MHPVLRPCTDADQLRAYIDTHWRHGHVLARSPEMFRFTYCTPWVDRARFPQGISVLGLYDAGRMVGFLGAIAAPYPRPRSYWLALWHVLPELKGGGYGGQLLQRMQDIALEADGWIGTFGAGPEALPVYLKRGFCVRAGRRWVYEPDSATGQTSSIGVSISTACEFAPPPCHAVPRAHHSAGHTCHAAPLARHSAEHTCHAVPLARHSAELLPDVAWFDYRYQRHPVYRYEISPGGIFRTEQNEWGRVTHACWLATDCGAEVEALYRRESAAALSSARSSILDTRSSILNPQSSILNPQSSTRRDGSPYLLDAWAFDCPGPGWRLAPEDLPSVFHPVAARGNITYAVGRPFLVTRVHKGDCDQDRPNLMDELLEPAAQSVGAVWSAGAS